MSLEQLPNGDWKVRHRDAAGKHRAKTFKKGEKKLAQDFEDEVKRAKRLGYLPQLEASKHTVGEIAGMWWGTHGQNKAPRTVALYNQLLQGHVIPTFDGMRLGEVNAAVIEDWLAKLDTGPVAKRNALGVLSQVFNYALRAGYVQGNPCQVVQKPKLPDRKEINPPAPLEVERIRYRLFAMDRPGDAFMVGFMAYAGPRSQELRDLDWADIKDKTVMLRSSKTGNYRAVKLLAPLLADMAAWKLQSGGAGETGITLGCSPTVPGSSPGRPTKPVFPTSTGLRFTKTTYDNWRNRVWSKVAPEGTTPYDLRHTFVSLLLRDPNVSRVEAAEQAGHNLQTQDKHYAHLLLEGQGSAEDAIRHARAEVFGDEGRMAV